MLTAMVLPRREGMSREEFERHRRETPLVGFAGAIALVGLTALLADDRAAGAGARMALNSALSNRWAAVGAAVGGALLVRRHGARP